MIDHLQLTINNLPLTIIMQFIDVSYGYLAPILLLVLLFLKKQNAVYCRSLLAAMNVSLVFFVIFACREYYNLYLLAKSFGFNISFKGLMQFASTNIPYFVRNILILLLPFCFLFKKTIQQHFSIHFDVDFYMVGSILCPPHASRSPYAWQQLRPIPIPYPQLFLLGCWHVCLALVG